MIDIVSQYRIIAAGAGWIDKTARGRVRFDGADRAAFLQALLSNEIAALPAGAGTYALYLTPQGRLIADLHVFVRADHLIVDVPDAKVAALTDAIDRLIFAEDVRVSDQSSALQQLSIVGGGAAGVLARALNVSGEALRNLALWSHHHVDAGFVVRTDDAGEGSWDLVIAADAAQRIVGALEAAGAVHASSDIVESMRIDAGRPAFGVDMTEETIPLEAGLQGRAISQTKGCYVGQEVIIRVLHRGGGRVARRLVRIECEGGGMDRIPVAGAVVSTNGREVGRVTSAAFSPRVGRVLVLAYVHRDSAEAGKRLTMAWESEKADGANTQADGVITALAG